MRREENLSVLILFIIILFSRVIFISNGYGLDADAWRIVQSGQILATKNIYIPSRFPGYPLPEIVSSFFWISGLVSLSPCVFNFFTALLSLGASYYFFLILTKISNKQINLILIITAGFAFTPLFYINSTGMMDYNWALFFILGSVYFMLLDKHIFCALFLALATSCRITSIVIFLPILLYIIIEVKEQKLKTGLRFLIFYFFVAAILFLPLFSRFGVSFLHFDQPPGGYDIIKILGRVTIRVWGVLGFITVFICSIILILNKDLFNNKTYNQVNKNFLAFSLLIVILYLVLFLSLPLDAGYLIPVIPFALLFFTMVSKSKTIVFLSISLIISPFFLNLDSDSISLQGPVLVDHDKRVKEENYINEVISFALNREGKNIIICEAYLPKIELTLDINKEKISNQTKLIYTLSYDSLQIYLKEEDINIYYLKGIREQILLIYNYDLDSLNAKQI